MLTRVHVQKLSVTFDLGNTTQMLSAYIGETKALLVMIESTMNWLPLSLNHDLFGSLLAV